MSKQDNDRMYELMLEVHKKIGKIETETAKQSVMLNNLDEKIFNVKEKVDNLGTTVGNHQTFIDNLKGKILVVAVFISIVGNFIVGLIRKELNI